MATLVRKNSRWRENYNPLRGLVMTRVVSMLEAAERGEFADLQWTYRLVEKRYAVLRSLIARRAAALLKLDWSIKVVSNLPAGATQEMAVAQRRHLRAIYERITNIKDAIRRLAQAEFRGYTILQKHRDETGRVSELHWLPQWNFVRDGLFGDFYWNPDANQVTARTLGEDNRIGGGTLPDTDFIIRTCEAPIDEIGIIAFMRGPILSQKDWDAFVEVYGLPGAVVIMPPDIPAGKETEYESAAESVAEGASGALPNGSGVEFPTQGIRGNAPFKEHLEWQEKDVVLAGTGGKLTMLNEATGIGGSQGEVHQDAFDDIAQGEAAEISEIFQRQIDDLELDVAFPGQPHLVYFELAATDREDADSLTDRIQKLESSGLKTDAKEVSEKVGLKLERVALPSSTPSASSAPAAATGDVQATALNGAQVTALAGLAEQVAQGALPFDAALNIAFAAFPLVPRETLQRIFNSLRSFKPRVATGQTAVLNREAAEQLGKQLAADLQPVRQRLAEIARIDDPALQRKKLEALQADFEQVKKNITADPESAREIEQLLALGIESGLGQSSIANRKS